MIPTDTVFVPIECLRCGRPTLVGHCDGLRWRLAGQVIPRAHAAVLSHYGTPVLVLDRCSVGIMAGHWDPACHDLTAPNRYLACPHVCGSAAARGLEMA